MWGGKPKGMKASTGFSPTRSESKYWCTEKKPASSCLPGADRCGDSQPFPEKGGKCSAPPGEAVPRLAPPCQADLPGLPCPVCVDDTHVPHFTALCFTAFCANWRSVAILHRANLLVPFFQEHLLFLCLCVTCWRFSQYFNLFRNYYMCYSSGLRSVTFDVTAKTRWRLRRWLAFFSDNVFFSEGTCIAFLETMLPHT